MSKELVVAGFLVVSLGCCPCPPKEHVVLSFHDSYYERPEAQITTWTLPFEREGMSCRLTLVKPRKGWDDGSAREKAWGLRGDVTLVCLERR